MAINLKTGKQEFVLNFDEEQKRSIWFNPCDPDLSWRMKDCEGRIKARVEKLPDIELDSDGQPIDSAMIETYRAYINVVKEEIDRAFNAAISETLFEFCSPFADIGDGTMFFVHFLEAIMPEIQERVARSREQTNLAMKKHLDKYGYGKK